MQQYLIDKNGVRRKAIITNCLNCNKEFLIRNNTSKGKGKYCSQTCKTLGRINKIQVDCAWCRKKIEKKPSALKNSKSGLYFCNRKCKDEAQKIGGIKEIMPPHYGTAEKETYRELFQQSEFICRRCGYNEFVGCVDIHHIDENHKNNEKANLMPLCATCHKALHWKLWKLEELGT